MLQPSDLIIWVALMMLPPVVIYLRRQRPSPIVGLALVAGAFYVAALIGVTMGPVPLDSRLIADLRSEVQLENNWTPFSSVIEIASSQPRRVTLIQIGGNLILLVPFGFLLPVLSRKFEAVRYVAIAAFALTICIETMQLLISALLGHTYKIFDIDDLWLNVIGALVGWLLWRLWYAVFGESVARHQEEKDFYVSR